MSVVFNHAIRHQVYSRNPIRLVWQSAKRRKIPVVLSAGEVQRLLDALALRERTLVLLDVGTGLRMSELFGLKWKDVDFDANEISVVRSIVMQVTGPCQNRIVSETHPARSITTTWETIISGLRRPLSNGQEAVRGSRRGLADRKRV
jgi:integrase